MTKADKGLQGVAWTRNHSWTAVLASRTRPTCRTSSGRWRNPSSLSSRIAPARARGCSVDLREVTNTLLYQNRTGCQWAFLPHDLLPKSTVYDYFTKWRDSGLFQQVVDALALSSPATDAAGPTSRRPAEEPSPSAVCVDSQTVKTTEIGGESGYDGNKKIDGRKRHIIVDTLGLLVAVVVTAASVDDGFGARKVVGKLQPGAFPRLQAIFGDSKYRNHEYNEVVGWA